MLNKELHNITMNKILKDIYSDTTIAPLLGFKGGTCAYLFYNLPRFSVDLDFDLLDHDKNEQELLLNKIVKISEKYGEVKDKYIKRYTIFVMLSYKKSDHNIKIEINIRNFTENSRKYYEINELLGTSMLIAKKEYLFATKLIALTERKEIASRDIFDILYFGDNNWDINEEIIMKRTNNTVRNQLNKCLSVIEKIPDNIMLRGLGELVDEKQKNWIKKDLKKETIFMLKNYIASFK